MQSCGPLSAASAAYCEIEVGFDVLCDYGIFRDLQRHRLATQINQPISASHGYLTPPEIASGGFEEEYRRLMSQAVLWSLRIEPPAGGLPVEAPEAVARAYLDFLDGVLQRS